MEKKKKDIAIKVLKGTNNETGTRITLNTIENTTESWNVVAFTGVDKCHEWKERGGGEYVEKTSLARVYRTQLDK